MQKPRAKETEQTRCENQQSYENSNQKAEGLLQAERSVETKPVSQKENMHLTETSRRKDEGDATFKETVAENMGTLKM